MTAPETFTAAQEEAVLVAGELEGLAIELDGLREQWARRVEGLQSPLLRVAERQLARLAAQFRSHAGVERPTAGGGSDG